MNGSLFNGYDPYFDCLNEYKVTFKDGTVRYTRAKCPSDAKDNVCWFGDVDKTDEIVSVNEV